MRLFSKAEIQAALSSISPSELIQDQEAGFVAYSQGKSCVPEVGHLYFNPPPGDCHIKYGYIQGDETFAIKVATGFYENHLQGLPNGNGLTLIFNQTTGIPQAFLLDEGLLTDVRTAIAGAISTKYLGSKKISRIGIIGTGTQARLQLEWQSWMTGCQRAMIWGRTPERVSRFCKEAPKDLEVIPSSSVQELTQACELIICCTASKSPVLFAEDIKQGTHIIAVGADGNGKQELDPKVFNKADICSVDSLSQCLAFGDSSFSNRNPTDFIELGSIIELPNLGRQSEAQITISDLTGIAVQDIKIAQSILKRSDEFK